MPRPRCKNCTRPSSECYCDHLVTLDNPVKVLIIQHPSESDHPYNTGRMANLCLNQCELVVHEQIPAQLKAQILAAGSVLLFPDLTWLAEAGQVRKLFNTSGQDYRALGLKDKLPAMSEADALEMLASNGMLVSIVPRI